MELNTLQIINILKNYKSTKNLFIGVFPRDRLPQKLKYPSCFIINTDKSSQPGKHWLALYYNGKKEAEFFDSYGNSPEFYNLQNYLSKTSIKWTFNKIQVQSLTSKYCGHYCCLYLLYKSKSLSLEEFLSKFTKSTLKNDLIITNLLFLFY
jgi:hypothetical protein